MGMRDMEESRSKRDSCLELGFTMPSRRAERRVVLMSSGMADLVSGPWENTMMGDRFPRLRADLENLLREPHYGLLAAL